MSFNSKFPYARGSLQQSPGTSLRQNQINTIRMARGKRRSSLIMAMDMVDAFEFRDRDRDRDQPESMNIRKKTMHLLGM